MTSDDEYRRQASAAQHEADRARNDMDRESWLRIAQGWLSMIREPAPTPTETFDAEATAKRTDGGNSSDTQN